MSKVLGLLFVYLLTVSHVQAQTKSVNYYINNGWEAYKNGNTQKALIYLEKADSLRPAHTTVLRYLAIVSSENGNSERAVHYLNQLALVNANKDFLDHEAFEPMYATPAFREIEKKFEKENELITVSDTAFTLKDKLLHPQGIAFDPSSGSFLISSIHKGKVIRKRGRDMESDFVTEALWGSSGMAADTRNRWLWVGTGGINRWQGYDPDLHRNKSKVIKANLETGRVLEEFYAADDNSHFFGDLVVQPGSDHVYMADTRYPAIYMIDPDNQRINLVKHFEDLVSLNAITFSDDGKYLFFSDYWRGLFRYEIATDQLVSILPEEGKTLKAIDGLYFYNNSLIIIQRRVIPRRITRCNLSENLTLITTCTYLEKANPILNEPTQGVLVGDVFYYVANSSWRRYSRDGTIAAEEEHPVPLVMKINLKDN